MPFHRSSLSRAFGPLCAYILAVTSAGADLSETALPPLTHQSASLTVVSAEGDRASYTPAEIEQFQTYRLTTQTPWRDDPATFEGIRLRDFLAAHGLAGADAIKIRAENDFVVTMERAVWEAEDFLIATRVDGRAHSRRARGPIQFVLDWEAYQASPVARESHLVWMAAEIAPME